VEESFLAPDFMSLKAEIESSGGNVQPIKVRPIGADKFEIVFGHRRHRACLELGIEVLATIESVEDAQLFTEMDRENRERQALRPYETGLMYARALDQGLFASARKLSEAISADLTYVGRALKLARLPDEVIRAFRSPLELQFAWASELSEALQKDPDGVLLRAKGLAQRLDKPPAKDVLRQLIQGGSTVLPPKKPSLRIKGKFGEVVIDVSRVDVSKVDALERAIRTALGG
jgi:ParB family chromosome partitioning protein